MATGCAERTPNVLLVEQICVGRGISHISVLCPMWAPDAPLDGIVRDGTEQHLDGLRQDVGLHWCGATLTPTWVPSRTEVPSGPKFPQLTLYPQHWNPSDVLSALSGQSEVTHASHKRFLGHLLKSWKEGRKPDGSQHRPSSGHRARIYATRRAYTVLHRYDRRTSSVDFCRSSVPSFTDPAAHQWLSAQH